MWIKKSEEEFRIERKKRLKTSITLAFFSSFGIIIFICLLDFMGFGGGKSGLGQHVYSLNQVLDEFRIMLLFSPLLILVFAFAFYKKKDIICEKCWNEKNSKGSKCPCGGEFIDLNKYKWINAHGEEKNPIFDEIKNLNWNDFKNKYNILISDFIFLDMTLDVPDKFKFTNPNLYLVIKNILELTNEISYLQIVRSNKSYIQITLNSEDNFILVYHEKKSYLVESSRNMRFFNIIEALNLYHNDFKNFEKKYTWIELVNTVS